MVREISPAQNIRDWATNTIELYQQINWSTEFHLIEPNQQSYFNFGDVIIRNRSASLVGVLVKQDGPLALEGVYKVQVIYPNGTGQGFVLEDKIKQAGERIFSVLNWNENQKS